MGPLELWSNYNLSLVGKIAVLDKLCMAEQQLHQAFVAQKTLRSFNAAKQLVQ